MNIEGDTAAKISFPVPVKEEEELAELEFEEDHEEETGINQPSIVPVAVASKEVGSEGQFSLPSILQDKVLDIVLKLHPAQGSVQPQLWLGLKSGQYPPLLKVWEGLDLGQLAFQLALLLEEYAHQIEATNAARVVAAAAGISPKPVIPSPEPTSSPVKTAEATVTSQAGKAKNPAQLSFF